MDRSAALRRIPFRPQPRDCEICYSSLRRDGLVAERNRRIPRRNHPTGVQALPSQPMSACNREYLSSDHFGANYGGILILFDRLFGTFVAERYDVPCRYGLVKPLFSYNPVHIALHEWMAMGRDLIAARNWRERFRYVFGPPDAAPPAPQKPAP
jgi:hypothetical protein